MTIYFIKSIIFIYILYKRISKYRDNVVISSFL